MRKGSKIMGQIEKITLKITKQLWVYVITLQKFYLKLSVKGQRLKFNSHNLTTTSWNKEIKRRACGTITSLQALLYKRTRSRTFTWYNSYSASNQSDKFRTLVSYFAHHDSITYYTPFPVKIVAANAFPFKWKMATLQFYETLTCDHSSPGLEAEAYCPVWTLFGNVARLLIYQLVEKTDR